MQLSRAADELWLRLRALFLSVPPLQWRSALATEEAKVWRSEMESSPRLASAALPFLAHPRLPELGMSPPRFSLILFEFAWRSYFGVRKSCPPYLP